MNILHLLSQNQLTGAELYAVTLARAQIQNGHKVFQISNGFYTPTLAEKHCLEVESKSRIEFKKNTAWLVQFIQHNQIHIIHSHSRAAAKMATLALKKLPRSVKVGHVSTVHGYQHPSFSKKLFNHYGHFQIAVCNEVRSQLINDFNYNPRRIHVVPNPIDLKKFYWLNNKKNKSEKIKNLNIAIIGRTTGPKKNRTEIVLNELQQLSLKHKVEIKCTLMGGKISDLDLKNQQLNITEKSVEELSSEMLSPYDLIIGSGRVALEALISGTPLIAFGESNYEGLITLENYKQALESNFGDIQSKPSALSIDSARLAQDFKKLINHQLTGDELFDLSNKTIEIFGLSQIYLKIQRIYESALLMAIYKKWIPVLMYHKIPNQALDSQHRIFVTKENFVKHLLFFKNKRFTTLSFQDIKNFSCGITPASKFPKKPLVLTFDDGYVDNLQNASPLLKQLEFKAEIFLLADTAITENYWDMKESNEPRSEIVSGKNRSQWKNSGFSIGSHGWRHERITEMNSEQAEKELLTSKQSLEKEFLSSVVSFAYTYGDTSAQAAELAEKAGYSFAVNTDTGGFLLQEDPYQIFRVSVFPEDTELQLRKKTSSWYRKYYYWKRKK